MSALWQVLRLIVRLERRSLWRGAVLSVAVLAAGAALLGLSGWFITASGLAGMAGIKLTFDVFRPSAGVRFLALGRTAARYGERLLTHEATLRALVTLRLVVLARQMRAPSEALARLRGGAALNRIVSDVDALDGLTLRLVLPLAAGVVTLAGAAVMLGWLVHPLVGALVAGGYALGGGLALMRVAKAGRVPSITAEAALQRLRLGTIELLRGRSDLIVFGQMQDRLQDLAAADHEARAAARALDRIERRAGLALGTVSAVVAAGALALGGGLVVHGVIGPAAAALGFFAALALAETVSGLRRGLAELGRMQVAAAGVMAPETARPVAPTQSPKPVPGAPALSLEGLRFARPEAVRPVLEGFDLTLARGEWLALRGPSGTGKSTVLALAAGLLSPGAGVIRLWGQPLADWPETDLRARLMLVPQRGALIAGTVMDNLSLACAVPDRDRAATAVEAVALGAALASRGGLDCRLGEGGTGLSGGETRRLILARAILRAPEVLLLDEPTEGLDHDTARRVLAGLRAALPKASVLLASHRAAELACADRVIAL